MNAPSGWPRASYLGVGLVAALAFMIAIAFDAILGVADALPAQVRIAMTEPVHSHNGHGGIDIWHVCFKYSDSIRGFQIGLGMLLLGGVPAALVAAALARQPGEQRWSAAWGNIFAAGFLFQLCSFAFTTSLLLGLALVAATDAEVRAADIAAAAAALLSSSTCSLWGMRSWRILQGSVQSDPLSISLGLQPTT